MELTIAVTRDLTRLRQVLASIDPSIEAEYVAARDLVILRGVVEDIAIRDAAADTAEAFVGAGSASDVGLAALLEGEDGEVEVANRSETQGRRRRPSGRVVNLIRLTALPSFLEERIAAAIEPLAAGGVTVRRIQVCLLYTSPSPRDQRGSRMPSSA